MAVIGNRNIMLAGLKGPKGDKGDKGERGERGPEGNIGKFVNADINSLENPTANTYYIHTTETSPIPFVYSMAQSDLDTNYWKKNISDESISVSTFLQKTSYVLKYRIGGVEYTTNCKYAYDEYAGYLVSDNAENKFAPFKLLGEGDYTNYDKTNQLSAYMAIENGGIVFTVYGYGDYAPATYTLPDVEFISLTRLDSNEGVIYFYDGTEFKAIEGGGATLNKYYVELKTNTKLNIDRISNIIKNAKSIASIAINNNELCHVNGGLSDSNNVSFVNVSRYTSDTLRIKTYSCFATPVVNVNNMTCDITANGNTINTDTTPFTVKITYYNDTEIL